MIPICICLFSCIGDDIFLSKRKKKTKKEKAEEKTQTYEQFNESLFQWKIILVAKQYNVTHLKSVLHETDNIQLMVPKLHIPY